MSSSQTQWYAFLARAGFESSVSAGVGDFPVVAGAGDFSVFAGVGDIPVVAGGDCVAGGD